MHKHCCTQLALEAHNITCRKFYARHVAADKMATAPNIVVAVAVAVLALLGYAIRDPNNSTSQDHIICHHRRRRRRRTLVIVCGPQLMPQCMQQAGSHQCNLSGQKWLRKWLANYGNCSLSRFSHIISSYQFEHAEVNRANNEQWLMMLVEQLIRERRVCESNKRW